MSYYSSSVSLSSGLVLGSWQLQQVTHLLVIYSSSTTFKSWLHCHSVPVLVTSADSTAHLSSSLLPNISPTPLSVVTPLHRLHRSVVCSAALPSFPQFSPLICPSFHLWINLLNWFCLRVCILGPKRESSSVVKERTGHYGPSRLGCNPLHALQSRGTAPETRPTAKPSPGKLSHSLRMKYLISMINFLWSQPSASTHPSQPSEWCFKRLPEPLCVCLLGQHPDFLL